MPGTVPFPDATSGSEMLTQGQETGCPLPAPSRIPIASEGSLKITRELPVHFLKFTSCDLFIFFFNYYYSVDIYTGQAWSYSKRRPSLPGPVLRAVTFWKGRWAVSQVLGSHMDVSVAVGLHCLPASGRSRGLYLPGFGKDLSDMLYASTSGSSRKNRIKREVCFGGKKLFLKSRPGFAIILIFCELFEGLHVHGFQKFFAPK